MSSHIVMQCVTEPCPSSIRVGLLDTTLREGEQTPGVNFTVDQKIEIAKALSDLGVQMIEAGHPSVSPDVREAVKKIILLKREGVIRSEIVAHSRAHKLDVEVAAELEPDRIAIFYGVSDIHLKYKHKVSREEALAIISEAIEYAKEHDVKVRFTAEDATRADYDFLVQVIKAAKDAGADRVSIADTVGTATPQYIRRLIESLRRDIPDIEFDIHAHNDLGLALANSLAAVEGGATIIHVTVNGLGERAGITPLQQAAVAIKKFYGLEVVDLKKIMYVTRLVEQYSGVPVPPNAPIVGDNAFTHKAGIHVAGILSNPATYEPFPPEWINRERDYVIDKYTGKKAVKARLERLGIKLSDEEVAKVVEAIKSKHTMRFLRDEDLLEIVEEVTGKRVRLKPPEEIEALIMVKCNSNIYTTSIARRLSLIPGVVEVLEVTGERDLVLKVKASNPMELNQVIEGIRGVKGVLETYTMLVLRKLSNEMQA